MLLTAQVHDELNLWWHLIHSLDNRFAHLREIIHTLPHGQEQRRNPWRVWEVRAEVQAGNGFCGYPHWGSNGTMSTEKVKLKRGHHHQQPGANGIHCAPPNFLPLDVATATHCDQGGKYHRRSMGTTRQHDLIHRSRPALEGGGLY